MTGQPHSTLLAAASAQAHLDLCRLCYLGAFLSCCCLLCARLLFSVRCQVPAAPPRVVKLGERFRQLTAASALLRMCLPREVWFVHLVPQALLHSPARCRIWPGGWNKHLQMPLKCICKKPRGSFTAARWRLHCGRACLSLSDPR